MMYDIFDGEDDLKHFGEAEEPGEPEELDRSPLEDDDLDAGFMDVEAIEKALDIDDEDFDWPVIPEGFVERRRKERFRRYHKWADEEDCKHSNILLPSNFHSSSDYVAAAAGLIEEVLDSEHIFSVESYTERECRCISFDIEVEDHEIAARIVLDGHCCSLLFKPRTVKVYEFEDKLRAFMDDRNLRQRYGKWAIDPADGRILLDHSICTKHCFSYEMFWDIWDELNISLRKMMEEYDFLSSGKVRNEEEKKIISISL